MSNICHIYMKCHYVKMLYYVIVLKCIFGPVAFITNIVHSLTF